MEIGQSQLEISKVCVSCLEEGFIVKRFSVTEGGVYCVRCGDHVGSLDFDRDLVTGDW